MDQSHPTQHRLKTLDGLRALAVLLVLAVHTAQEAAHYSGENFMVLHSQALTFFLLNSGVGVHLFFVLSGFLITGQLLQLAHKNKIQKIAIIKSYIKRRLARIVPAYYVVMTFCFVILFLANKATFTHEIQMWTSEYLRHIFFMADYFPSKIMPIFWSLAVEMKFYFIAPIIVLLLLPIKNMHRCIVILLAMVFFMLLRIWLTSGAGTIQTFEQLRNPFHMCLEALLAGMCCQFIWSDQKMAILFHNKLYSNLIFWGGLFLFLTLMCLVTPYHYIQVAELSVFPYKVWFFFISIALGMMLLGLLGHPFGHKIFECRILEFLALISYSLYLTHILFLGPVINLAIGIFDPLTHPSSVWALSFTGLLLIATPVSALLYFYIEKPCINWSKKPREIEKRDF